MLLLAICPFESPHTAKLTAQVESSGRASSGAVEWIVAPVRFPNTEAVLKNKLDIKAKCTVHLPSGSGLPALMPIGTEKNLARRGVSYTPRA